MSTSCGEESTGDGTGGGAGAGAGGSHRYADTVLATKLPAELKRKLIDAVARAPGTTKTGRGDEEFPTDFGERQPTAHEIRSILAAVAGHA